MAATLAYTRKFIILKKEFSTIVGISPKGHGKLEVKGVRGTITINIENAERDNFYNVLFISNDRLNSTWDLGKIFTDDIGRGKGEYVFTQRELESKNFPVDEIAGILITRDKGVLLGGYIDKENGCIERYIQSMLRSLDIEPISELMPEVEDLHDPIYDVPAVEPHDSVYDLSATEAIHDPIYDTPAIEPTYEPLGDMPVVEPDIKTEFPCEEEETIEMISEEDIEEQLIIEEDIEDIMPEQIPEEDIEEIFEDIISEEILEVVVEDIMPEETAPEETEEIALEGEFDSEDFNEEDMEPDYKTLDHIRRLNQKNQTTNYVLSILRFFPYIDPFKYSLKGYNWWIVELDKDNEYKSFLPYFSYVSGGNTREPYASNITTCNELMSKYQHYLFGLYNEGEKVKYFVYGIPGNFTQGEHPYRGASGFNTWHPGQNIEGYWLIFIDPMTGKPVDITVPMMPID